MSANPPISGTSTASSPVKDAIDAHSGRFEFFKQTLTLGSAGVAGIAALFTDTARIPTERALKYAVAVAGVALIFVVLFALMGLSSYANLLTALGRENNLISGKSHRLSSEYSVGVIVDARRVMIVLFVAGICLTVFAASRLFSRGSPSASPIPSPIASSQASPGIARPPASGTYTGFSMKALGCVGPFAPGEWHDPQIPANRNSDLPCHWTDVRTITTQLKGLRSPPTLLLFIGSADKTQMRRVLSSNFGSNQALARARANWVSKQVLNSTNFSSNSMPNTLVLTVGPGEHGRKLSTQQMENDRSVAVFAFWLPGLR